MRDHMWKGCVSADRNGWLAIKIKVDGRWRYRSLKMKDSPANRDKAERVLREVRDGLQAKAAAMRGAPGPVTVRAWSRGWMEDRRGLGLADVDNDQSRLDMHVMTVIGDYQLAEVRPRHILEIVTRLRASGHAPRTVYNVHSVTKAMFRDAAIADLMPAAANPCILTHRQLGKIRDKRPGWRDSAVYTRDELAALVWDERVPLPRRVLWALLGVGMMRAGEVAGLRWGRLDLGAQPLGRISIVTSYDHDKTKTETERWMPVHPATAPRPRRVAPLRLSPHLRPHARGERPRPPGAAPAEAEGEGEAGRLDARQGLDLEAGALGLRQARAAVACTTCGARA